MDTSPTQPQAPQLPEQPPRSSLPRWLREFLDARASVAFLAGVLSVFLLCWQQSGQFLTVPHALALKYGAYDWALVRDQGEWWRFFSGIFVARMGLEALIYVFLFIQLGPSLEKALGTPRFVVLYVASGAGAIAFAEVFDPGLRLVGPILPAYALLGAIPGMTFAATRSLRKTAADPNVQSSVFWIVFALVLGMMIPGAFKDYTSVTAAAVLAALLAAGLQWTKTAPKLGLPVTATFLLLVGGLVALAVNGKAFRDGKLTARGIPAGMAPDRPQPLPTQDPSQGTGLINAPNDPEATESLVAEVHARVHPFLERFGPLPTPADYLFGGLQPSPAEEEEAAAHLDYVDRVAMGGNQVEFGAVEPERIRLMLLLGKSHRRQVVAEASDYHDFEGTPESRALYGLALLLNNDLIAAEDMLGGALDAKDFDARWPSARYHYAFVVFRSQGEAAARVQFERFLEVVGRDPDQQPAHLRPLVEQALVELR